MTQLIPSRTLPTQPSHSGLTAAPGARPAPTAWAALAALGMLLGLAAPVAQAAGPATLQVMRSIETPYPAPGPFHPAYNAWFNFQASAPDYGLQWGGSGFSAAQVGSFQGSAAGVTVNFGGGNLAVPVSATFTSQAGMWARVQQGPDPIAFVDFGAGNRWVHVATQGGAVERNLLTIQFSRPVQGVAFLGAGISDYCCGASGPSQQVRLDGGPGIDIVGVPTNTVRNPVHLSFGLLSPTPFSSLSLVLPAGSDNDNAGISNLLVAVDPQAVLTPVPEPQTWALLAAGLVAIGARARRHRAS